MNLTLLIEGMNAGILLADKAYDKPSVKKSFSFRSPLPWTTLPSLRRKQKKILLMGRKNEGTFKGEGALLRTEIAKF